MASPAPYAPPSAPPAAPRPQAPPPGLTLARWLYVDERRTHEVHAGVRKAGERQEFVVKESGYHNDDPAEVMEGVTSFQEPWEAQLLLMELENRLGLLGKYWRFDVLAPQQGWTLVRPQAFASLDLRPVRADLFEGRVAFYHFHKKGSRDVALAAIPQDLPRGRRHALARLALDFPFAEEGDLRVVHARLAPAVFASVLAREHLDLREHGYERLFGGPDFALVHGKEWRRELHHAYETLLRRLSEGRLGEGGGDGARPTPIDGIYTDYLTALTDPRLLALHARFLEPGEEQRLLGGGEPVIRKWVSDRRKDVPPDDQHLLTILQASLLARDGLRAGHPTRVDPEVAALVRRFAFYL